MTNPSTTDRRDVAHPTDPIGGHEMIEKDRAKSGLGEPLDTDAAKMPIAGRASQIGGVPQGAKPEERQTDAYTNLPDGVPPARSGQSGKQAEPASPTAENPERMDQQRADGRETAHVQSPRSKN